MKDVSKRLDELYSRKRRRCKVMAEMTVADAEL